MQILQLTSNQSINQSMNQSVSGDSEPHQGSEKVREKRRLDLYLIPVLADLKFSIIFTSTGALLFQKK